MKNLKILALATVAASVMASSAYAGANDYQFNSKPEQRLAQRNFEYFQHQGNSGTAQVAGANKADYQFNSRPEKRMAARNQAYFDKIGYKGGEMKHFNRYTDVSEYPFSGSVLSAERGGYVWSSAQAH